MKKILFIAICVVVFLVVLHGCAPPILPDPFVVTLDPASGHPPFDITITATGRTGGKYIYEITGREAIESNESTITATIDTYPCKITVTWIDGNNVATATARPQLVNEIPVAHELWTIPSRYEDGQLVMIDLRYLEHGCVSSTGEPSFYSGFEDPDGDTLQYRVLVEDMQTGEWESVFYGPDRTLVKDEYISNSIFYWFVNHTGAEPIIPYEVWSPLSCGPSPPLPPPDEEVATREKRIHVYILEVECGSITHWTYDILTT